MSFEERLLNRVTLMKRSTTSNETGEVEEHFRPEDEIGPLPASVQDRSPAELSQPDIDGPVVINAVIFLSYRTDVDHLDQLRQTDVSPNRVYRVVYPRDPAGLHHHLEVDAQYIARLEAEPIASGDTPTSLPFDGDFVVTAERVRAKQAELRSAGRPYGHRSVAAALNVSPSTVRRRLGTLTENGTLTPP